MKALTCCRGLVGLTDERMRLALFPFSYQFLRGVDQKLTVRVRAQFGGLGSQQYATDYRRNRDAYELRPGPASLAVYGEFLGAMKNRGGYWHALPRDVARWWKKRSSAVSGCDLPGLALDTLQLAGDHIQFAQRVCRQPAYS